MGGRGFASLSAEQEHGGRGDPMWAAQAIVSVVTCVIKSPGAGQEEVRSKAGFEHSWTLLSRSGKE